MKKKKNYLYVHIWKPITTEKDIKYTIIINSVGCTLKVFKKWKRMHVYQVKK